MALNKRKVLDAARKYAQKGAKEKALKEYGKLLKVDSRDAKLLLEIGDAHRRWGQNEEAISHYTKVAEQYKSGGFDARAVAVFKQIINLDAKRYTAYVSLADLYQRMGLDTEAGNALQTAADGYHKEGQKTEALELLRKMATLDPSNTTSRMKVADLLRQEEMLDDAVAEYEAVAEELVRQGATDQLVPVYERVLEIQPERDDVQYALARALVQLQQSARAEPFARKAFDKAPDTEGYFDLLNSVYSELGRTDELTDVTKRMAQVYRDKGDDDRARELMQRLPGGDELSIDAAAGDEPAFGEPGDDDLLDDDFLDDDFLGDGAAASSDDDSFIDINEDEDDALELDEPAAELPDLGDDVLDEPAGDDAGDAPEGDPDQLFAEASVYLRYGKRDQAITSLQAILGQMPKHRDALEKLGECYADAGDAPRAVDYWKQAAELAANAHDDAALDVLRDRIAVLDPDAAAELAPVQSRSASAGSDLNEASDRGSEIELDLDVDFDENEASASAQADENEISLDESLHDMSDDDVSEIEVDVDVDIDADVSFTADAAEEDAVEVDAGDVSGLDQEIELDDLELEEAVESDAAPAPAAKDSAKLDPAKLAEDLEEAEFYMAQELFDEAEAIYKRILEVSPDHPDAVARLDELQSARGEGAGASGDAADLTLDPSELPFEDDVASADEASAGEIEVEFDLEGAVDVAVDDEDTEEDEVALGADSELEIAVDLDEPDEDDTDPECATVDAQDAGIELSADDADPVVEEVEADIAVDVDVDIDEDDEVASADNTVPLVGTEAVAEETTLSDASETTQDTTARVEEAVAAAPEQADDDDSFDLAAELRDSLEDEEEAEPGETSASAEPTSEEEGFASIFKDFKSGVEKTLGEDDFETRFDLGIAYRGMELFDDALGEFRICLDSASHRLESLHMMGLCAIDLERFGDATNHLEQALASEGVPDPKQAGLRFDLGRAFEGAEDFERAKEAFESAREIDASIPSIDKCIERVSARINGEAPVELADDSTTPSAGGFEDFDDLVAEVEAEEEPEAEAFESFDDVVAEVEAEEAVIETAEIVEEDEDSEGPVTLADVDPNQSDTESAEPGDGKSKKRKKKRISFV